LTIPRSLSERLEFSNGDEFMAGTRGAECPSDKNEEIFQGLARKVALDFWSGGERHHKVRCQLPSEDRSGQLVHRAHYIVRPGVTKFVPASIKLSEQV